MEPSPRIATEQLRVTLRLRLEARRASASRRDESGMSALAGAGVEPRSVEARPRSV